MSKSKEDLVAGLAAVFKERDDLRLANSGIQQQSNERLTELRKVKDLLQLAYDELLGTRMSGSWGDTIDRLQEYLKPDEWHAKNRPEPGKCQHKDTEGN